MVNLNISKVEFEDYFPSMVEKLGPDGFMNELCKGFRLLVDCEKGVITLESLKKNAAVLGLQELSEDELKCMLKEGDLDGDDCLNQMEFCVLMFRLSPDLMSQVVDVKKNIEAVQGVDVYPASQQMLIHQGKVLKDETTLEQNNVADKSFIVIILSKSKASSSGAAASPAPSSTPMLQELGKQNPQLVRMVQEHQSDFLRLINEPVVEGEGNILGQLAEAMRQTVAGINQCFQT